MSKSLPMGHALHSEDMSYIYRYGQCDIQYEGNQDREVASQP